MDPPPPPEENKKLETKTITQKTPTSVEGSFHAAHLTLVVDPAAVVALVIDDRNLRHVHGVVEEDRARWTHVHDTCAAGGSLAAARVLAANEGSLPLDHEVSIHVDAPVQRDGGANTLDTG